MINYSIIIPHKNIPDLLQRCLDSIPVRDDVQVIVVDDNSDADKVDFEHFPKWNGEDYELYLTKEGKGAGYARNIGLKHAKGEWVLFADADDYYFKENLNVLFELQFPETSVVVWKSKRKMLDGNDEYIGEILETGENSGFVTCHTPEKLYSEYTMPWTRLIRRRHIETNNIVFEEVRYSNDEMFSARLGASVMSYDYVDLLVYCQECRQGSLKESPSLDNYLCRWNVWLRKARFLEKQARPCKSDRWLSSRIIDISYPAFLRMQIKKARFLGLRRTWRDYSVFCMSIGIDRIPYLTKCKRKLLKKKMLWNRGLCCQS